MTKSEAKTKLKIFVGERALNPGLEKYKRQPQTQKLSTSKFESYTAVVTTAAEKTNIMKNSYHSYSAS